MAHVHFIGEARIATHASVTSSRLRRIMMHVGAENTESTPLQSYLGLRLLSPSSWTGLDKYTNVDILACPKVSAIEAWDRERSMPYDRIWKQHRFHDLRSAQWSIESRIWPDYCWPECSEELSRFIFGLKTILERTWSGLPSDFPLHWRSRIPKVLSQVWYLSSQVYPCLSSLYLCSLRWSCRYTSLACASHYISDEGISKQGLI